MIRTQSRALAALLSAGLLLSSCESWRGASNQTRGAVIGAGGGAVAGAAVGRATGNTALGAILGAAVGGAAGTLIGRRMDKQAQEIEQNVEGAQVERVGEGILVNFESGILFGFDSEQLSQASQTSLRNFAQTLQNNPQTDILIEGHTDSVGSDSYNERLSRRRAESVADYLAAQGVSRSRLVTKGYGESQPVASNETDAGRAENRRVTVAIYANEQMQQSAQTGQMGDR